MLKICEHFVHRHGRRPSPEAGDELALEDEDLARTLFEELYRYHLPVHDFAAEVQDEIAEYTGGGTHGWALLFIDEYEPVVFGFKVVIGPPLKPALLAERAARAEARLDPDYTASRARGRRILGLDSPFLLGPDGQRLN